MLAKVDKNVCIGCGLCSSICPNVFSMGEDGLAVAITAPVPTNEEGNTQEACDSCPVNAIRIID